MQSVNRQSAVEAHTNMEFSIRSANLEDAASIAGLLRALGFARMQAEQPDETRQKVRAQLERCLADDSHAVLVAESAAGDILGYAAVHWLPYLIHAGPEGYVSELFIDEACRGQGIGSALLDEVTTLARQRGCARLSLLNMRGRESYLRGFYKQHGWEERPDAANFVLLL